MKKAFLDKLASFNLFTAENIPIEWKEQFNEFTGNKWRKERISNFEAVANGYDFTTVYRCDQDTRGNEVSYYIDEVYVVKETPVGNIAMLQIHKNKFHLFPYYRQVNKVTYQEKQAQNFFVAEPNQIGVFSEKKVNDWLKYCDEYIKEEQRVREAIDAKKSDSNNIVNSFIGLLDKPLVRKYENETYIDTELFEVKITVLSSGTLSKEIRFKGELSDIANIHKALKANEK